MAEQNLRIMTWNLHVLPKSMQMFQEHTSLAKDIYGVHDGERLREKIVPRVLRIDPDIVVFQEASRGNVGDWQKELLEQYSHAVTNIDADGHTANSGLMVFSRFPFVPFDSGHCNNSFFTHVSGTNNGQDFDKGDCLISTHIYNRSTDPGPTEILYVDANSAKAAAIVRVQTPWGCIVNVAFTHMTASYGKDDISRKIERQEARGFAFKAMADLIEASLTPAQLANEPLFFVGDLNVDGSSGPDDDLFDLGDGKPTQYWLAPELGSEWGLIFTEQFIGNSTDFFTCGADGFAGGGSCPQGDRWMTDAWAFEHPLTDNGATFCIAKHGECDPSRDRLDYIAHNHPVAVGTGVPYLCASHLQRLWGDHPFLGPDHPQLEVDGWDGGRAYTDHLAVFGDFAFTRNNGSQCNPIEVDATSPQLGPDFGSVPVIWKMQGSLDPCEEHAECSGTESCQKGMCEPNTCVTSAECPAGISCVSGECRQYCATDDDCSEQGTRCLGWCAAETEQDHVFPVTLAFPRQHIWFKIGEDNNDNGIPLDPKDIGTYSIGVLDGDEDDVEVLVYQGDDLSWPVAEVHKDTVVFGDFNVKQFFLDKPPYYVRVSVREDVQGQAPSFPSSTDVIFRKNQCTDPFSDVCVLTPGAKVSYGWPGPDKYNYAWDFTPDPVDPGDLSGAVCGPPPFAPTFNLQSPYHFDYMYFRFFVDAAPAVGGGRIDPDVQFLISNTESDQFDLLSEEPGLGLRIFDASGEGAFNVKLCDCGQCPAPCNSPIDWEGFPGFFGTGGNGYLLTDNDTQGKLAPSEPGVPRPFILRIHRTEGPSEMSEMTIEMLSSMTKVEMISLTALENNDEPSPRDEIRLFVRQQGEALPSCDPMGSPINFSQSMNEKDKMQDGFPHTIYSLVSQPLEMRMCEDDLNPDDHYGPDVAIFPLDDGQNEDAPSWNFCDENWPTCEDANYLYFLQYTRRHELMEVEDEGGDPVAPICP